MEILDAAVLGGGITGLSAAHRLRELSIERKLGLKIALFEAGDRLGGTIHTERANGFVFEHGPDAFLSEKPELLNLLRRLKLEREVIGTFEENRRSFVIWNRRLCAVPQGFYLIAPSKLGPFLASDLFSWRGKMRMLAERFVPRLRDGADESITEFVTRRFGVEALERAGQPMLAGIYGGDPDRLSLSSVMPKFRQFEVRDGSVLTGLSRQASEAARNASGPRYNLFLSMRTGLGAITEHLGAAIGSASLRLNCPAISIGYDTESEFWKIEFEGGCGPIAARSLVVALPAPRAAALVRGFSRELGAALGEIRTESAVTMNLAYHSADISRRLDGFGFVVPRSEALNVIGGTFSSVKFPGRAPADSSLIRLFAGGAFGRRLFEREDDEIVEAARRDVDPLLGIRAAPFISRVWRHAGSMPQYDVGHAARVARIRQESSHLRGFALAGNYFAGVGLPDCVREGEAAAEYVLQHAARQL